MYVFYSRSNMFFATRICASPVTFYNDLLQFLVSDFSGDLLTFGHTWSQWLTRVS